MPDPLVPTWEESVPLTPEDYRMLGFPVPGVTNVTDIATNVPVEFETPEQQRARRLKELQDAMHMARIERKASDLDLKLLGWVNTPREAEEPKAKLRREMESARSDRAVGDIAETLATAGAQTAEALSPAGLMNQPTRIASAITGKPIPDQFAAGRTLLPLGRDPGTGIRAGLENLTRSAIESMATPEGIVTAPAAIGSGIGRAAMAAFLGSGIPELVKEGLDALRDKNATPAEKVEKLGRPVLAAAGTLGLAKSPVPIPEKLPRSAWAESEIGAIEERMKGMGLFDEQAKQEQKGATDASKVTETTTVHGNVPTQPGKGEGPVPIPGSGQGIQPPPAGGIPAPKTEPISRPASGQERVLLDTIAKNNELPIVIERADGTRYTASFGGYYELGEQGNKPSIGRGVEGDPTQLSHGMLRPGEKIITQLPTLEQWKASKAKPGTAPAAPLNFDTFNQRLDRFLDDQGKSRNTFTTEDRQNMFQAMKALEEQKQDIAAAELSQEGRQALEQMGLVKPLKMPESGRARLQAKVGQVREERIAELEERLAEERRKRADAQGRWRADSGDTLSRNDIAQSERIIAELQDEIATLRRGSKPEEPAAPQAPSYVGTRQWEGAPRHMFRLNQDIVSSKGRVVHHKGQVVSTAILDRYKLRYELPEEATAQALTQLPQHRLGSYVATGMDEKSAQKYADAHLGVVVPDPNDPSLFAVVLPKTTEFSKSALKPRWVPSGKLIPTRYRDRATAEKIATNQGGIAVPDPEASGYWAISIPDQPLPPGGLYIRRFLPSKEEAEYLAGFDTAYDRKPSVVPDPENPKQWAVMISSHPVGTKFVGMDRGRAMYKLDQDLKNTRGSVVYKKGDTVARIVLQKYGVRHEPPPGGTYAEAPVTKPTRTRKPYQSPVLPTKPRPEEPTGQPGTTPRIHPLLSKIRPQLVMQRADVTGRTIGGNRTIYQLEGDPRQLFDDFMSSLTSTKGVNRDAVRAEIVKVKQEGASPEFRALFTGVDPGIAGTTAERVRAYAKGFGLDYQ